MNCEFFCLTDPGRVRGNNEDAVALLPEAGLAVLADGMGGYRAGEVASELATQGLLAQWRTAPPGLDLDTPQREAWLRRAIDRVNRRIFDTALARPECRGMGTTLVAAWFQGARVLLAHVGDARAYRWRQGQLVALTRDHSLLQEHIDAGLVRPELARAAPYRNIVTRAMGVAPEVEADLAEHVVLPGDTYLLCSDGLNDMLTDGEMGAILRRAPSLAQAGQALCDAANAAGGRDNISLVLAQCRPTAPATTLHP